MFSEMFNACNKTFDLIITLFFTTKPLCVIWKIILRYFVLFIFQQRKEQVKGEKIPKIKMTRQWHNEKITRKPVSFKFVFFFLYLYSVNSAYFSVLQNIFFHQRLHLFLITRIRQIRGGSSRGTVQQYGGECTLLYREVT